MPYFASNSYPENSGGNRPTHVDAWANQWNFLLGKAHELIIGDNGRPSERVWKCIWRWKGPERIRVFLWLVARSRIVTAKLCYDRCGNGVETVLHALRDCPYSQALWNTLVPQMKQELFFQQDFSSWLHTNLALARRTPVGVTPWSVEFGTACWFIWRWRNEVLFEGKQNYDQEPIQMIKRQANTFWMAWFHGDKSKNVTKWVTPKSGWIKLNTDGASTYYGATATAGGIFRDDQDNWMGGFVHNIGICMGLEAELWGGAF